MVTRIKLMHILLCIGIFAVVTLLEMQTCMLDYKEPTIQGKGV